jgi:hypothetical protein
MESSHSRRLRRARLPGRAVRLAATLSALGAIGLVAAPIAEPDPVEEVGKAATEWVKTRMETARLETEWSTQRQLLESMVGGLTERAQTLEAKRDYVQAKTAKDREELAAFDAANKAAIADLQVTEEKLKAMSDRLKQLRPALPPRLSAALEMPFRSLSADGLNASERMQLCMTVLNRCTQFNRSITCEEEILDLGDGKAPRLLEVVYWGLGYGYALDRASDAAWLGSPGPQGWRWESRPDAAKPVARLIAIYHEKSDPDFVTVPARVVHVTAESSAR